MQPSKIYLMILLFSTAAQSAEQSYQFTPQNTVIVFDIHNVIVQFSPLKALKAFINSNCKQIMTNNVFKYLFKNQKAQSAEGVLLTDDLDRNQALEILNPHTPITGTVQIMQDLVAQGYRLFGCSNIGQHSYAHLQQQYPDVFKHLQNCYTSSATQNYIKKSNPQFFLNTVQMIQNQIAMEPTNFIFIDDSRSNLKLATKTDQRFVPVLFKSPAQLRSQLRKLNILS